MITSPSNTKLKYVRHLGRRAFRDREDRMVLEGVRLVEEALSAECIPSFVLVSDALARTERGLALRARLGSTGAPVLDVEPKLLEDVSDTATPQGVVAVVPRPQRVVPDAPTLVLVLDGVRDPGNVGTALRSAQAAGADAVLLAPGCSDPTAAKVVRAAMGAHFHLSVQRASWAEIVRVREQHGLVARAASAGSDRRHTAVDWTVPSLLIVGGEADGVSDEARGLAEPLGIHMPGSAESLNAGVAAAVILFEAVRQRS